jgi:hypothetical protein
MKRDTDTLLAKAAMAMRGASPPLWDEFMRALALRVDDVTEACVSAPPDALQERQGRAREIRDLFKVFYEAPKLIQQLQEMERANAHARRQS